MPEENQAQKVIPGGIGCQGFGCVITILLIIGAFVLGVIFSEQSKEKYHETKDRFSDGVKDKIDTIKDKVK